MTTTAEEQLDELNRRIEDLRAFEREYRYRLKAYLTQQLAELEDRGGTDRWPRQEIIGPEWTLIVPGLEVRANGNGAHGRVCIEIRKVTA